MPTTIEQIPRDSSGVVVGEFRLRHRDPGFSEALGPVVFDHGVTTGPVTGRVLERVIAALGAELDMEPWGFVRPMPAAEPVIEPVSASTPDVPHVVAKAPVVERAQGIVAPVFTEGEEPAREASAVDLDELPNDKDALLAIAGARGVPINTAWSAKAMRRAIRAHQLRETKHVD